MLTNDWLTDAVLYIYALSLLFFVSDAAYGKRNGKRIGTGLLVFVWILQTGFLLDLLVTRFASAEVALRDFVFFISWLLVSFSLALLRFVRAEVLVLLVNVAGFAVLFLNLLERPHRKIALESWEVARRLLYAHIGLITLSFAILTVAAILAGMYLFLHWRLKKKKWGDVMNRMPSLEAIDRYSFRTVLLGVPLLLLSLSTGLAALLEQGEYAQLLDAKVLLTVATSCVYAYYLFARGASRDDAPRSAVWNLTGYLILIAGVFVNSFSSFHK
ncbi:cytochrome c biogenesis protein CcsA [Cohnella algarum]|uniref:cytochrome c biogenesis protein CcsA n=1 Tax=Cohnella algarum TaxID=2044859 RepID=UPI00196759CD|nr:cytochrome c biogenesis protein CcsA [Cohnella algarum]MBN2984865.1 cytochrome c biogenesis protein CcsA [Cohnella algarum]